jgi:hypothetical protein
MYQFNIVIIVDSHVAYRSTVFLSLYFLFVTQADIFAIQVTNLNLGLRDFIVEFIHRIASHTAYSHNFSFVVIMTDNAVVHIIIVNANQIFI